MKAGLSGVGVDVSPTVVDNLNSGRSHIHDLLDADISWMRTQGFVCSTDGESLVDADVIITCVPTPLGEEGGPDLAPVRSAAESGRDHLTAGIHVVLESTTWPGTTDEVLRAVLEVSGLTAGVDFHLAYSTERIDPGNPVSGIVNRPNVVRRCTSGCLDRAGAFYGAFVTVVVPAKGTREPEMSKLLENTYRQVNIATVNEMARLSHELSIDIWDVTKCASSKPFGFQLGYRFRFVELAQEINRGMPSYVVQRAQRMLNDDGKSLRGVKVLIPGVTDKAGIADQHESTSLPVGNALLELGVDLSSYDSVCRVLASGEEHLQSSGRLKGCNARSRPHHPPSASLGALSRLASERERTHSGHTRDIELIRRSNSLARPAFATLRGRHGERICKCVTGQ